MENTLDPPYRALELGHPLPTKNLEEKFCVTHTTKYEFREKLTQSKRPLVSQRFMVRYLSKSGKGCDFPKEGFSKIFKLTVGLILENFKSFSFWYQWICNVIRILD